MYLSNNARLVDSYFIYKALINSALNPKFKIHNFASFLLLL